jgi:8-oxo-dGTP diphosphatase
VLSDAEGRVLVAQRPPGKHLAGRWEFPGGKLHEGELPLDGLKRELAEELGVAVEAAEPLIRLLHDYPDRRVLLDVWQVTRYTGTVQGLDRQALDWVKPDRLPSIDLLEADRPIITALRLPRRARCVHGLAGLIQAARGKTPEALFWRPERADRDAVETKEAVAAARRAGHRVLVSGEGVEAALMAATTLADGLLLEPTSAQVSLDPGGSFICGALCRTPSAARAAVKAGAHFIVLSLPEEPAHEERFAPVLQVLGVPAYLGWYRDHRRLARARTSWAHGCAIGPFSKPAG